MNLTALAYYLTTNYKNIIVVLKDNVEVEKLYVDLNSFLKLFEKGADVCPFFSYEIPPHSSIKPADYIVSNRLQSIYKIVNSTRRTIFITNINALIQPTVSLDFFVDNVLRINVGDVFDIDELLKRLNGMFYKRVDFVEDVGEFTKRGSVIDIFSPFYDKPLRIDFFDDEVEDIRLFYPENQKTAQKLDSAIVLLAREYRFEDEEFGYGLLKDKWFLCDYPFEGFEKLSIVPVADVKGAYRLIDFYKEEGLFEKQNRLQEFLEHFDGPRYYLKLIEESMPLEDKIEILKKSSSNLRIVIGCGSEIRLNYLRDYLRTKRVDFKILHSNPSELSVGIYLTSSYFRDGFLDKENGLAFVSFGDLFGKSDSSVRGFRKRRTVNVEIEVGDRVVHKKYGIGKFNGLKRINVEDKEEDFFEIEYDEGDKIYLPVYNAEMLLEYYGSEPLSSLRNNKWQQAKENLKNSIKKILTELVSTYAKRQLARRKPYDVNLLEIREFEIIFEYDETQDQLRAIEDIKKDMSSEVPMDRLICGDVSFGKTEVASRAIAICVFNFRQAVFMVPTTLLSLQHYKTLKERFANFPVRIALLNRFTTKKEKERILSGLKSGSIDILIATHSVYSDSIEFADLGLVVIDEEHRFGVKIKEHLKSKYPYVDMLYLSATPIPRTLNMALNSILDISVIKTPPIERKPIETIVSKRKISVIRDAILRELSREGRVYFVHNMIEDIEKIKEELDNLLPFAKKAIVHAKMPKKQIKSVFEGFNNGEYDILISTSIIESGLDIKSVDTIIIDDADRFGLSDLYQLRGRVGRADKVAYAYLLYKGDITENARKRLSYMEEFFERGSGFHLALKDMELRGYGNILGKDQSGKIKSVGFSTYVSLIEEAVKELNNQPVEREVEIKHSFDAFIPNEYAEGFSKVNIYKRLSSIKDLETLENFKNELLDRFGRIPEPVDNLFFIVSLKILAKSVFVKKLSFSKAGVVIEFYVDADINTDELIKIVNRGKGRFINQTSVYFGFLDKNLESIFNKLSNIFRRISKQDASGRLVQQGSLGREKIGGRPHLRGE